jgi:hypothetical protein
MKNFKEIITEDFRATDKDIGRKVADKIDELKTALKKIKNPEKWAETFFKSAPSVLDNLDNIIKIFKKMK